MEKYLAFKNEAEKENLAVFCNPLKTLSAHQKVKEISFLGHAGHSWLTVPFNVNTIVTHTRGALF